MSTDKKSGNLLDALRVQSDAMRVQEDSVKRTPEEALKELDRRMWKSFKWLDEVVGHLAVIRPVIAHDYRIPEVLVIPSPQFDQGFVSYRRRSNSGQDVVEYIELFYRLTLPKPIEVTASTSSARGIDDRLRAAQLKFQYKAIHDEDRVVRRGTFQVNAEVTAFIKFVPDYRRQTVEVTLRNVDRFETVVVEFTAEKFDDAALEDLIRFILGEDNAFLRRAPLVGIGARKPAPLPNEQVASYRL
jgi:hypothetical protein